LLDAEALVGHLVPVGSMYRLLAEHRRVMFAEGLFADLFPSSTGRPSVPGEVAASVLVLQNLHAFSDREAMEALRCDLRWKVACGLPLDHEGYHPTVLTYWRGRLARSERPDRIFEAVRGIVAETGVLAGKTRRAVDSMVLDDAVATQDTVTQLVGAIRRVARQVPGAARVVAARCTAHDYTQAGKPRIDWDDPAALEVLVSALVTDARTVLAAFADVKGLDETATGALGLLALVAGQDVEPAEGSDGTDGRWRIARKVAPDRVISTVDVESRHVHKTVAHRQDGYKGHVVIEPDTGLFTDGTLTRATGEDNQEAAIAVDLLTGEQATNLEILGDSAYGTGQARVELSAAGHTPILKPPPLRIAVAGGFTLDDFTVDEQAATVTCPNGLTRKISPKRYVTFGAGCAGCPLRARCTTSRDGRSVQLHPHHTVLAAARHQWATDQPLRETYRRHRPMVERSIAWFIAQGRHRKLRYHGQTKNNHWFHLRMATVNLTRLLALGLTRTPNGHWTLAPTA
jgi:hypothetical protein